MFEWTVAMQTEDGQVHEVTYRARWSPEKVSAESVALSCAAEHTGLTHKKHLPLTATLVG